MVKAYPATASGQQATHTYEIRTHRDQHVVTTQLLAGQRDLLAWVLREVGSQALREFVLRHFADERITTQQAADLLGMSRPTLIKLVESGGLPHSMVGNRRYLPLRAVEEYRLRDKTQPAALLDRAPDEVIAANLRLLQQMAEEEGDFA
jgi:excisionase family DNA binding protein